MDEASLRQCGPHRVADYENRLVEVKHGGAPVAAFEYDGLGRRIKSTVGSVVTRFIYDGDAVLEEYAWDTQSSSWVLAAVYVHGIGVDNAISIERDGEIYYYHYDGYGSVSELTDEDGALAQAYEYDAWGIATIYDPESAIENPYLYTGRRWDAAISLYYYRARHYAPTLGRFLQPDPIGYEQTTNLYAYVGSSPTIFIDPTGMEAVVAKGDEVYWYVEKLSWTGVYDVTTERRVVGTLDEGNNVQLREKYGGGTISLDEARAIAERTGYLGQGGLSAATITGTIGRALHGNRSSDSDGAPSMLGAAARSLGNDYVQMEIHAIRMVTDPKYAAENVANTAIATYQEATYVEREYGYNRWSYLAGEIIGANTFSEGVYTVDVPTYEFIDGVESTSRILTGGGQMVGTATAAYAGATALANRMLPAGSVLRTNLVGRGGPVAPRVATTLEQPRNALGQFGSTKGGTYAAPGSTAETQALNSVDDLVAQRGPGYQLHTGRVHATNNTGQVRVYDGMVETPSGHIALEVKSGGATRTTAQRVFDSGVSTHAPAQGFGKFREMLIHRVWTVRWP